MTNEFAKRRRQLSQKIGTNAIAIVSAAAECRRNGDSYYPYRQNSDFYYLTGFPEPEAIAVIAPGRGAQGEYILFNRPRDPAKEVWTGRRAGQLGACKEYGADVSYPIHAFKDKLLEFIQGRNKIYFPFAQDSALEQQLTAAIQTTRNKAPVGAPSGEPANFEHYIHDMRLFKSDAEIDLMRKAAKISAEAHCVAMRACKPNMHEYELEALLQYEFYRHGSRAPAYNSIVAGGANSCILHYNDNNAVLKDGELVLIDAACEYDCYASDITRTFPVNGRFSKEQRAIYELVLSAQLAVIAAIKPGVQWNYLQELSERVITEGLLLLGILHGDLEILLQTKASHPFYMHRLSHWIGMDVHDVGDYKLRGAWRTLEPRMVFTVEPGVYIAAGNAAVDKKWWDIGVRIEDDVLVTPTGCEVLSQDVPKSVKEIEALMACQH